MYILHNFFFKTWFLVRMENKSCFLRSKIFRIKGFFLFMLLSQFVKRQFGSQSNAIGCIDFYGIYWKDLASLLAPGWYVDCGTKWCYTRLISFSETLHTIICRSWFLFLRRKNPDGHFLKEASDHFLLCQLLGTWTTHAPARPVHRVAICKKHFHWLDFSKIII